MDARSSPRRTVWAAAPVRICDLGGWTDTWFAQHGKVLNIGVRPGVDVRIDAHDVAALPARVVLHVESYGDHYGFELGARPGRHPLLEATIDDIGLPEDVSVEISVSSRMPAGSSTGTSASTAVALTGALDALTPGRLSRHDVARTAHRVETDRLGMQSGIQDQLCAAYGGVNFIEVVAYPDASVTELSPPDRTWSELDRRLVLVTLGRPHVSTTVHEHVIAQLSKEGSGSPPLQALRAAAEAGRRALLGGDLNAFGRAMTDNTEAQRRLHPSIVGTQAQQVIDVASVSGAVGWKVNGAGGAGGSLTILCGPDPGAPGTLERALHFADAGFKVVPTRVSDGLRVRESEQF